MEQPRAKTTIIAITDFTEHGNAAVQHAATLALRFQATLTIVTHYAKHPHHAAPTENEGFRHIVENFSNQLEINVLRQFFNRHLLYHFAEKANAIMYVIGVARRRGVTFFHQRRALRFIAPSRLPVLTVGKNLITDDVWKNILVTNDIHRQEKEKMLWAGYFYRFGKSDIHLLHNAYPDADRQEKMVESLEFVYKLYQNLEIPLHTHSLPTPYYDLDSYAVSHARDYHASLLVMMTTTYKTWIDLLFGTREQHLIANKQELPILFLNDRDDLYVLCT